MISHILHFTEPKSALYILSSNIGILGPHVVHIKTFQKKYSLKKNQILTQTIAKIYHADRGA